MKYRPITRILSLAAALFILPACTPHNLPDGWYTTSGEGPDTRIGPSIVTCSDFAALHLDSLPSGEGTFIYQITGTVKPEKQKRWTAATIIRHSKTTTIFRDISRFSLEKTTKIGGEKGRLN